MANWYDRFIDTYKDELARKQRYRSDNDKARMEFSNAKKIYKDTKRKAQAEIPENTAAIEEAEKNYEAAKRQYRDSKDMNKYNYLNAKKDDNGTSTQNNNTNQGNTNQGNTGSDDSSGSNGNSGSSGGSNFRFSDTFYRELGAAASDRKGGNTYDQAAEMMRNQARVESNAAADNEKQAQRAEQAAGRNINAVADERAVAAQQSQDKQRISKAKTTGANTALLRSEVASDPAAAQAEKVEQQRIANERQDKADEHKFEAAQKEGMANELEVRSRDNDTWLDRTGRLARGNNGEGDVQQPADNPPPPPAEKQTPPSEPEPQNIDFKAQNVINGILDGSNGANLQGGDKVKFDKIMSDYGLSANFKPTSQNRNKWEAEWIAANGGPNGPAAKAMQELRQSRAGDGGNAATNYNRGSDAYNEMIKRGGSMEIPAQGQDQAIPAHASGTDCAEPGPALVGEEGPELVINNNDTDVVGENGPEVVQMEGGEKVIPNEETEDVLGKLLIKYLNEDYDNGYEPSNLLKKLMLKHLQIGVNDDNTIDDNEEMFTYLSPMLKRYADRNRPNNKEQILNNIQSKINELQSMLNSLKEA